MDIILVETAGFSWDRVSGYLGCVTRRRRESIAAKKNEQDKLNSLFAELLVLSEISRRTGIPTGKISFSHGSFGKPYLKGRELEFSLTHTAGAVCAAFSMDGEIGVDIERADRRLCRERMAKRVLSEQEKPAAESDEEFLRVWVQKEAFLKRTGVGITRDLRGINTLSLPDTTAVSYGDYLIGISGKGAANAQINRLSAKELLSRFIQLADVVV